MIRLGSLGGYSFEGPRVLAGWTPPAQAAVYCVLYKPRPDIHPDNYAVIYVDHSEDLSKERFPFKHAKAPCWIKRAGDKFKLYICSFEVPGGTRSHREVICQELNALYHPGCNDTQWQRSWERHWIGDYDTPNTARPLTTSRDARFSGERGAEFGDLPGSAGSGTGGGIP
ncbi:MAG: hypothetical protein ACRDZ8_18840 [Acidimicrobiales bacterium]